MLITAIDIFLVSIVVAAFAFGVRAGVASVILIRPLTDRTFELAGLDIAGHHVTYGILINIVVICVTIVYIVGIRRRTPAGLQNIWIPFLLVCASWRFILAAAIRRFAQIVDLYVLLFHF